MRVELLVPQVVFLSAFACRLALAQPFGEPDRGQPGDAMVQAWLERVAGETQGQFLEGVTALDDWQGRREQYRQEYLYMLGLGPLPERTPLEATVTGTLEGDGFVIEKLHYQSRPKLYVTANLYRPTTIEPDRRLPAVLYVCGHSGRGRNGNKTAFQSHGMWFARHGYVCLVVDTLQLGEIAALHHGTYREGRWWWHSRGYTPAGVECWNGVRGIDYLVSRPDVDAERIAVTGISGGGAATFWVSAADERVKVAVPVSGMADLPSYVPNRVINGHCDCMFLYNTFQWPWARIASLIAPRPMLFTNSDADRIFPMDANERLINRLERVYSLYGASDSVDAMVSIGGHAYRDDLRRAAYRFINRHLQDDPRPVTDSEVDLVTGDRSDSRHPIPPEELRVFPTDADLPADELNTTIDEHFVPLAKVPVPAKGEFETWKKLLLTELRRVTFRSLPERVPAATKLDRRDGATTWLETEAGIHLPLDRSPVAEAPHSPKRLVLIVRGSDAGAKVGEWIHSALAEGDVAFELEPRGFGRTAWTIKDPPNYVARCHVLLGTTVDTGRVRDIVAAARYLHNLHDGRLPVHAAGAGNAAVLAAYAALLEPDIAGVIAHDPPATHMQPAAPQFLNVLRACDIPDAFGLLAPRPLVLSGRHDERLSSIEAAYEAADSRSALTSAPSKQR